MSDEKIKSNDMTKVEQTENKGLEEKIRAELEEKIKAELETKFEAILQSKLEKFVKKAESKKAKAEKENDVSKSDNQIPRNIQDWLNERVPFYAFKDNDKYKDDIVIGVNGKTFIIQRGVQVMIPRYVKMLLDDSMAQDTHAANVMQNFQEQHNRRAQELGIG